MLTDLADRQYADWQIDKETSELEARSPAGSTWRVATDQGGGRMRSRLVLVRDGEDSEQSGETKQPAADMGSEPDSRPRIVWRRYGETHGAE